MARAQDITIANILDVFFKMEVDEGLFSARTSDGIFFWDIVRRDVYLSLHTLHGGPFTLPEPLPAPSPKSRAKDLVKPFVNLVSRRYLQSKSPKYIFITAQRILRGTSLVDNISDPLYDLLADEAVAVELMNKSAIDFSSLFTGGRTRIPPVALRGTRNEKEAARIAGLIDAAVYNHFGLRPDFTRLVGDLLSMHQTTSDYYRRALRKFLPKAIIGVNNGTLSGMFAAAKEHGVPAIELQHGASTRHSIMWSYPPSIAADEPGLSLPNAYLTYSDYWTRNTHFPVKLIRSIGNDSLFQERVATGGNGVLMISSYMYREALVELAMRLAEMDPGQQIYFKLHPHEFNRKTEVVAAFGGRGSVHVISDDLDFPDLFRKCGYVVGVQSTVFYLALQAGCRICLLKRSNYFWHDDIFDHVELFDDATELHHITHRPLGASAASRTALPEFSTRLDAGAFLQALADVQATACRA